jgi:hypothetical protein
VKVLTVSDHGVNELEDGPHNEILLAQVLKLFSLPMLRVDGLDLNLLIPTDQLLYLKYREPIEKSIQE